MAFLLLLLLHTTTAFLLDNQPVSTCWAPSPCVCDQLSLGCDGKSLQEVPMFPQSDREYRRLTIDLSHNMIVDVNNDSFSYIDNTNASVLIIDLSNNKISHISDIAFDGVESMVTELNLQNNDLREIPASVGKLTKLQSLKLMGNPITTLKSPVIFSLSGHLKYLTLSLDEFASWPNEMHYFRQLSKLEIDGYQQSRLPLNALANVEKTLTYLEISRSNLDRIPSVVCHLDNLHHLAFYSNPKTSIPIFEPCRDNLTSVFYLSLRNNSLSNFPDVFNSFTNLDYLDVSENNIRTIHTDLIPTSNTLTHLNISSNSLNRIPNAVNRLAHLKALYVSNNMLTSLEDFDLSNVTFLTTLDLAGNPIEYIADGALTHQQALRLLDLDKTRVKDVPRAISYLTGLRQLNLNGVPIECTCSMDYLKGMDTNTTKIAGSCEGTLEPLSVFIKDFLPYCP